MLVADYAIESAKNCYLCTKYISYMSCKELNRLKVVHVEQKKTSKWFAEQTGNRYYLEIVTNTAHPNWEQCLESKIA